MKRPAVNHPCGVAAALPLVLAVLLAGCTSSGQEASHGPPPAPVTTARAVVRDVPILLRAVGTVEAIHTVEIRARVGGELIRVGFEEGAEVKAGQLLFVIDPRPYRAALQAARAAVARDSARAALAAGDRARLADLIDRDFVTRQQYDQAVSEASASTATLAADEATLEDARLNLEYCTIHAPISGRTGSLGVRAGNLVKANDDSPLITINQIAPVFVSFAVPERYLSQIRSRPGDVPLTVFATLAGHEGGLEGRLTFINNAVDETTGTILLKATFPNQDRALWPGQFVDVSFRLSMRKSSVVVPARAVQTGQQGNYVYVMKDDGTVDLVPVTVGTRVDEETVIETGLKGDETVVTDGQLRLVPGAHVVVKDSLAAGGGGETAQ